MMMATTYLFVPATRPDRIEKALATTADVVIIDLEDAVAPEKKISARRHLSEMTLSRRAYVRINDAGSDYFTDDVAFVTSCEWICGVIISKVQSRSDVTRFFELVGRDVVVEALIESSRGVGAVDEIAHSGVNRLILGSADFSSELGVEVSEQLLAYPRSRMVVASAAAGIASPVDGPTLEWSDLERVENDAVAARRLGMGAKLCVHPTQLPIVAAVFTPTTADRQWAKEVVEAFEQCGGGVTSLRGEMIDAPVVARARRILES